MSSRHLTRQPGKPADRRRVQEIDPAIGGGPNVGYGEENSNGLD